MTRKMYFGNTVESAMALARRELGEEAWLVSARPSRPEETRWGAYAVEAAGEPPAGSPEPPAQETRSAAAAAGEGAGGGALAAELGHLRQQLLRLEQALASSAAVTAPARVLSPAWARLNIRLRAAGLPPELASDWIVVAQERAGPSPGSEQAMETLRALMSERLPCRGENASGARRRVAFAGPPGAGKTTLLVKLAWRLGLEGKRSLAIVSTDTQRIAAADQLRSYAALMGVPCRVADTAWGFEQALREFAHTDIVVIDTPGFGAREAEGLSLAARNWPADGSLETHLVLPAQASPADLWSAVVRFAPFRLSALAFTRLDETCSLGGLASTVARAHLPVSYLSFGQSVPEDFEPATSSRLCEWILGEVELPGADANAQRAAA